MSSLTHRDLLTAVACSRFALSPASAPPSQRAVRRPSSSQNATFFDVIRAPDLVTAFLDLNEPVHLVRTGARPFGVAQGAASRVEGRWEGNGIRVRTEVGHGGLAVFVSAPGSRPTLVHCRWNVAVAADLLVLGDHWERSYGDLHWSCLVPERVMPWCFLACSADSLHGCGVKTGAGALCFWQVDSAGVSLWLNVCNGGSGVDLGDRELLAATVVSRRGNPGEEPVIAARQFCAAMCDRAVRRRPSSTAATTGTTPTERTRQTKSSGTPN